MTLEDPTKDGCRAIHINTDVGRRSVATYLLVRIGEDPCYETSILDEADVRECAVVRSATLSEALDAHDEAICAIRSMSR
jgi:hypothetical protein